MQDIDELEDFNIQPASYEVWVLGYNRFDLPTGFELLTGSFDNPGTAVELAKVLSTADITTRSSVSNDVSYFSIEVETVVFDQNAGTIYKRYLENTKQAVDVKIAEDDYELTEDGNLKLNNSSFDVGNFINMSIANKTDTKPILLKVIYKEADYIICEFID